MFYTVRKVITVIETVRCSICNWEFTFENNTVCPICCRSINDLWIEDIPF